LKPNLKLVQQVNCQAEENLVDFGLPREQIALMSQQCRRVMAGNLTTEIAALEGSPASRSAIERDIKAVVLFAVAEAIAYSSGKYAGTRDICDVLVIAQCRTRKAHDIVTGLAETLQACKAC
jgi:hypothetical protein